MEASISVIVPTYNRARKLRNCLNSILAQTYENWECIVVDDGSTDDTRDVLASISDDRVSYFHKVNEERNIARNFGIDKAKGEYVTFLDSDDEFLPDHLKNLYDHLKASPSSEFILSAYKKVDEMGNELAYQSIEVSDHLVGRLCFQNYIPPSAVCVKRSLLDEFRFPNSKDLLVGEDLVLWLRLLARVEATENKSLGVQMNVHEEQSMTNPSVDRLMVSMEEAIQLLQGDALFMTKFSKHLDALKASYLSLAALSAGLNGQKRQALELLGSAFRVNGLAELGRKRNYAVLKNLIF